MCTKPLLPTDRLSPLFQTQPLLYLLVLAQFHLKYSLPVSSSFPTRLKYESSECQSDVTDSRRRERERVHYKTTAKRERDLNIRQPSMRGK